MPGRDALDRVEGVRGDGALAVDWLAQCVHHASHHRVAGGNSHDFFRPLDQIAFLDLRGFAQQNASDLIFFQIERHASDAMRELEQFAGHHLFQAMHAGNAIANGNDGSHFTHFHARVVVFNLCADDLANFFCSDVHSFSPGIGSALI